MSCSLKSLKGDYIGDNSRVYKGGYWSLDTSSYSTNLIQGFRVSGPE